MKEMIVVPVQEWRDMKTAIEDLSLKVALLIHRDIEYLTLPEACTVLNMDYGSLLGFMKREKIKSRVILGKMSVRKGDILNATSKRRVCSTR